MDNTRRRGPLAVVATIVVLALVASLAGVLGPLLRRVPDGVTLVGSIQALHGCASGQLPCEPTNLAPQPDGTYARTLWVAPGDHEVSVAVDGTYSGDPRRLHLPAGDRVRFAWHPDTQVLDVALAGEREPEPRASLRAARTDEQFYFVMTDRFANGDPGNDLGGYSGDRMATGFDPTDKGFYHGGDLAGVRQRLDYIQGLGTTAIWLTPSFVNQPTSGYGADAAAGYHGYWTTDFTRIDPHLGTNDEMKALVADAHRRGMRVYFDIIANHTADVIVAADGKVSYVSKGEKPYVDASGAEFDDAALAASGEAFPPLDAKSFPREPSFRNPADATAKTPAWLNDPTMYHNRGNSEWVGESNTYGDFVGLDDLFTERPEVVDGMTAIYSSWADMGIDGFRIDTVKHVNMEFWQQFSPRILGHVRAGGKSNFFMFGEVYTPSVDTLSEYTTTGRLPASLDFAQQAAFQAVLGYGSPRKLSELYAQDDLYIDADSNAYQNVTFLGNHDMGRIGMLLRGTGNAAEVLQRSALAHQMLLLLRGQPVVYYGDEQGFQGSGGDKDARQDMFATQVASYASEGVLGAEPGARDRYDNQHPLYATIARTAQLRKDYPALVDGAQVERFAAGSAGIYAVSRIKDGQEFLVVANTSAVAQTETVPVASRGQLVPVLGTMGQPPLWLEPHVRGRGIGTQAQRELVRLLFAHTLTNRVEAHTAIDNIAEQRSLTKAGFTQEGNIRGAHWRAGQFRDGYLYSILRTDVLP